MLIAHHMEAMTLDARDTLCATAPRFHEDFILIHKDRALHLTLSSLGNDTYNKISGHIVTWQVTFLFSL